MHLPSARLGLPLGCLVRHQTVVLSMAPRPAKPPSDDLLSSLASLAPTQDPRHPVLPFLLVEPNYNFHPTPAPTTITSPSSSARPNRRKGRRRDDRGLLELPLQTAIKFVNIAARVPPRFQPLGNGSWVATNCWTFHGRQSCDAEVRHNHLAIYISPSAN